MYYIMLGKIYNIKNKNLRKNKERNYELYVYYAKRIY